MVLSVPESWLTYGEKLLFASVTAIVTSVISALVTKWIHTKWKTNK
jgi:hypothetical protein